MLEKNHSFVPFFMSVTSSITLLGEFLFSNFDFFSSLFYNYFSKTIHASNITPVRATGRWSSIVLLLFRTNLYLRCYPTDFLNI